MTTNLNENNVQRTKAHTANSTFAIGGVPCSADSLVLTESFVLRINNCGKKPAHRKSAKRYASPEKIPNQPKTMSELGDNIFVIKDDFEIIELLQKLPADKITGDTTLLKHLTDKAYGKDFSALFGVGNKVYALYKYGDINDPGLLLVYVDRQYKHLLKQFLEQKPNWFNEDRLREHLLKVLASLEF